MKQIYKITGPNREFFEFGNFDGAAPKLTIVVKSYDDSGKFTTQMTLDNCELPTDTNMGGKKITVGGVTILNV